MIKQLSISLKGLFSQKLAGPSSSPFLPEPSRDPQGSSSFPLSLSYPFCSSYISQMDYVLFLLGLAAGTKQHLRPLIVQKAKCIMYQKISLECPAGEQLSSGLRFTLLWRAWRWGRHGGQGPFRCCQEVLGGHPLLIATLGPSYQLVYPGELHYSSTLSSFQPFPLIFPNTHTQYTHIAHTVFFLMPTYMHADETAPYSLTGPCHTHSPMYMGV